MYKTELVKARRPWRGFDDLEIATAEWVDWYNHRRPFEYCDDLTPVEAKTAHYAHHRAQPQPALSNQKVSGHAGAVQSADYTAQEETLSDASLATMFDPVDAGSMDNEGRVADGGDTRSDRIRVWIQARPKAIQWVIFFAVVTVTSWPLTHFLINPLFNRYGLNG